MSDIEQPSTRSDVVMASNYTASQVKNEELRIGHTLPNITIRQRHRVSSKRNHFCSVLDMKVVQTRFLQLQHLLRENQQQKMRNIPPPHQWHTPLETSPSRFRVFEEQVSAFFLEAVSSRLWPCRAPKGNTVSNKRRVVLDNLIACKVFTVQENVKKGRGIVCGR